MLKKNVRILIIAISLIIIFIIVFIISSRPSNYSENIDLQHKIINLDQAKERFEKGTHLFLDSRGELLYTLGHIKGAVNFPAEDFNRIIPDFEIRYPKNTEIVVYCAGVTCSNSYSLAKMLGERGYLRIEVFWGGWNDWISSNLPIEWSNNLQ